MLFIYQDAIEQVRRDIRPEGWRKHWSYITCLCSMARVRWSMFGLGA